MRSSSKLAWGDLRDARILFATVLGVGLLSKAPGTLASLAAVGAWWFWLSELRGIYQSAIILAVGAVAYYCIAATMRKRDVGDDPGITIDEVLGQWVALIAVPKIWYFVVFAFVAFRVLDILKPDPVGWADRKFKGPFGVLADDVMAGGLVVAVMHIGVFWFGIGV